MGRFDDCIDALRSGLDLAKAGDATATRLFEDVLRQAAKLPGPEAKELALVAQYGASLIAGALGREDERGRRLGAATALARRLETPSDQLDAVDLLADTLMAMGESQLAIAYCHRAIALTGRDASAAAGRLWRAGRCTVKAGFSREAHAPLRVAVSALRACEGDPRLPFALLDLGNACLSSEPAEAEPCYREAAELWAAAGHANQAATASLNLGVLCSRAERLDEALAWYHKVRAARAADPRATRAQRGNILNNIAGAWRRKGDFARARAEVARAIEILTPEDGAALGHALGTLAEIDRDEGRHDEAVVWFRRAREAFERQPSPNVEQLAIKLENEATALERVGRADVAAQARARAASLRGLAGPEAPLPPEVKAGEGARDGEVAIILDGVGLSDAVHARFDLATLERRIEARLEETGCGEVDGHEQGARETRLFLSGPDARALLDVVTPILREYPLCRSARVALRQGAQTSEFALEGAVLH